MPSRTARLSKKGCGFATPECRAQRDVAVHPRPAPPPPLLAAPRLSTTALGYLEIRGVVRSAALGRVEPDVLRRRARRSTGAPKTTSAAGPRGANKPNSKLRPIPWVDPGAKPQGEG